MHAIMQKSHIIIDQLNSDVCKLPLGPYSQRVVALATVGVQTASPNLRLVIGGDPHAVAGKCCPNLGAIIMGSKVTTLEHMELCYGVKSNIFY